MYTHSTGLRGFETERAIEAPFSGRIEWIGPVMASSTQVQERRGPGPVERVLMATQVEYPTSDGKPMAETDVHRDLMIDLIETLEDPVRGRSGRLCLGEHPAVLRGGEQEEARRA